MGGVDESDFEASTIERESEQSFSSDLTPLILGHLRFQMKGVGAIDNDDDVSKTVLQGLVDEFLVGIRDGTVKREVRVKQTVDEIDDCHI